MKNNEIQIQPRRDIYRFSLDLLNQRTKMNRLVGQMGILEDPETHLIKVQKRSKQIRLQTEIRFLSSGGRSHGSWHQSQAEFD